MTGVSRSATERPAQPAGSPFGGRRLVDQLFRFSIRACALVSKFLLAIYTARYLGLADLGMYGLLVGATTIVPAIVGLGMTEWISRRLVDLPRAQALPLIASRLSLTLAIHLVVQPIAFAADLLLGEPIPIGTALLCGAILLLENLGNEATDMLIARRRIFLAYTLAFLRVGFWPIPVMAIGLLYPETRTLEFLLMGWLVMLVVSWLVLFGLILREGRWRLMRPQRRLVFPELRGSLVLYSKDVSSTISMFLDRFLISLFLGLEMTGVYTLFWSIVNVVHSLAVGDIVRAQLPSLIAAGQQSRAGSIPRARAPLPDRNRGLDPGAGIGRSHGRAAAAPVAQSATGAGKSAGLLAHSPRHGVAHRRRLLRFCASRLEARPHDRVDCSFRRVGVSRNESSADPSVRPGGRRYGLRDYFGRLVCSSLRVQPARNGLDARADGEELTPFS